MRPRGEAAVRASLMSALPGCAKEEPPRAGTGLPRPGPPAPGPHAAPTVRLLRLRRAGLARADTLGGETGAA